jgi:hypothetical protein
MEDLELGRSGVVGLDEGRARDVDLRVAVLFMVCRATSKMLDT